MEDFIEILVQTNWLSCSLNRDKPRSIKSQKHVSPKAGRKTIRISAHRTKAGEVHGEGHLK